MSIPATLQPLFWDQPQHIDVAGSQDTEVAMVEGGQLGLIEAFNDRKDGSVDEPNISIGVTVAQFTDTPVVSGMQLLDTIGAVDDIVQEGHQYPWMEASMNPVVCFHQHGRRDH